MTATPQEMFEEMMSDESGVLLFMLTYFSTSDKMVTVEELWDFLEDLTYKETRELVVFALNEVRKTACTLDDNL